MTRIRVWELARLAGMDTADVVHRLRALGIDVAGHAATVDAEQADRFWTALGAEHNGGPPRDEWPSPGLGDMTLLRRVWGEVRPFRWGVAGLAALELLATPVLLLNPVPLKIAVDSALGDEPLPGFLSPFVPGALQATPMRMLVVAVALQILVVALGQIRGLAAYVHQTRVGEGVTLRFRSKLFRHSQHLSLAYHDRQGPIDALYRIEYDAAAPQYMLDSAIPFVTSGVMLLATLYVTARIDLQLAFVAVAVTPILYLLARGYIVRVRSRYRELKELETSALKVVQEVLSAVRVVKAFGREEAEQRRFTRRSGDTVRARVRLALAEGGFGMAIALTTAVGTAAVLFVGVRGVMQGRLTLGALLVVMGYLAQLYGPLQQMAQKIGDLQSSLAGAERAFQLLDEHPEVVERPDALPLTWAKGAIAFEQVWFSYDGRNPVLRNVSFAVEPGMRVGVVGPTGAGKTTLVSLITRFYDPVSGRVLLDGTDLRDYRLADLRDQFAIVLQDPVLFSTTIADNLRYARPDASEAQVVAAAEAAGAHDFVTALPEGYDTVVGERGMRLSGGERQRISLARAFLRDASILILDEPTSSVDKATQADILETMRRLSEGRTSLLISHRLSALKDCDAFLEVRRGRVRLLDEPPAGISDEIGEEVAP